MADPPALRLKVHWVAVWSVAVSNNETIFGIDLGTTHSAIGMVDAGFSLLLADDEGRRIQPSVVAFDEEGQLDNCGWAAKRQRLTNSRHVVSSVKRLMGRRYSEVQGTDERLVEDRDGKVLLKIADQKFKPEQISAEILSHLKRIAEQRIGKKVERVVITVPAYFNESQRLATKEAGQLAGLKVERIINEPTAAALAYGLDKKSSMSKLAVFDLGGGTFDLTVLELRDGVFEVLSTFGDTHLGGDDIDKIIALTAVESMDLQWEDLSLSEQTRLLEAAELAKCSISETEGLDLKIPFFRPDLNLHVKLNPAEIEALIDPLLDRIERHCRQAVSDSGLDFSALDEVVLVGGSTRLELVRKRVERVFGKKPNLSQHPDEAVALGAAIQGAILSGGIRELVLLDVTPLSLGIETYGGLMNVLIPRNTTIPCKAGEMFTNAADEQKSMQVKVLQGEREMARDNWPLGSVEVAFDPLPRGRARVGVQFSIDADGLLEVLARDTETNQDTILEINSAAVDVDDDRVEQMVSESVEFAFEDMNERVFTEAKMKADELLPAVAEAMKQLGDEISDLEKAEIQEAENEVLAAVGKQSAAALKVAVKRLDSATEKLATRLVEKALEDSVNRQLGL